MFSMNASKKGLDEQLAEIKKLQHFKGKNTFE